MGNWQGSIKIRQLYWWIRGKVGRKPLEELHQALGEFLTECGHLENVIFGTAFFLSEKDIEDLFDEYSKHTLGGKIIWFEKLGSSYAFDPEDRAKVDRVIAALNKFLLKRNHLVHGETYVIGFDKQPSQAYRVGVMKRNFRYLNDFLKARQADNTFTAGQVRGVSQESASIRASLAAVSNKLVQGALAQGKSSP